LDVAEQAVEHRIEELRFGIDFRRAEAAPGRDLTLVAGKRKKGRRMNCSFITIP